MSAVFNVCLLPKRTGLLGGSFEIFKLSCIQVAWANASIMTAPAVKTGVMKSQSKLLTFALHFYTLWV